MMTLRKSWVLPLNPAQGIAELETEHDSSPKPRADCRGGRGMSNFLSYHVQPGVEQWKVTNVGILSSSEKV